MLEILCLLVSLSLPWPSRSCLRCPQFPLGSYFHFAVGGPESSVWKDYLWERRLWALPSGAHGTVQGSRTSMLALLLCPPQNQDLVFSVTPLWPVLPVGGIEQR